MLAEGASYLAWNNQQAARREEARTDAERAADEEMAIARARRPLERFLGTLPAGYRWSSFLEPVLAQRVALPSAIVRARSSIDEKRVVLTGPAGCGKTSLGVAMLRQRFESHGFARFVHAYRLANARIQSKAGTGEAPEIEAALCQGLVLIDDVGNERNFAMNALPDVIFERHADDLPTWYTTAFSPSQIAAKYGDGIARRMFEHATIIRVGEESREVQA